MTSCIAADNLIAIARDLRTEAAAAGDTATVADCDLFVEAVEAVAGPQTVWTDVEASDLSPAAAAAARRIAKVVDDARAMDDGQ